jgi:hypothetical protein
VRKNTIHMSDMLFSPRPREICLKVKEEEEEELD